MKFLGWITARRQPLIKRFSASNHINPKMVIACVLLSRAQRCGYFPCSTGSYSSRSMDLDTGLPPLFNRCPGTPLRWLDGCPRFRSELQFLACFWLDASQMCSKSAACAVTFCRPSRRLRHGWLCNRHFDGGCRRVSVPCGNRGPWITRTVLDVASRHSSWTGGCRGDRDY